MFGSGAESSSTPSCQKSYSRSDFHESARKSFRAWPFTSHERRTLRRVVRCQRRSVSRRIVRTHLASYRRAFGRRFRWRIEHAKLSSADRWWAHKTSVCESGRNPRIATGNGFYGAHQWLPSTWRAAGGRGLPTTTSIYEQDVRAVRWRNVAGRGQWPVCGR